MRLPAGPIEIRGLETTIKPPGEAGSAPLRRASEFLFSTEELGPSPRGSDPVPCRLT